MVFVHVEDVLFVQDFFPDREREPVVALSNVPDAFIASSSKIVFDDALIIN